MDSKEYLQVWVMFENFTVPVEKVDDRLVAPGGKNSGQSHRSSSSSARILWLDGNLK